MGMPIISRSVHLHEKQSLTIIIVNAAAFVGPIIPHLEGLNNFSVGQLQNSSHLIGAAECGWRSLDQVSWCQACKNRSTIQCWIRALQFLCYTYTLEWTKLYIIYTGYSTVYLYKLLVSALSLLSMACRKLSQWTMFIFIFLLIYTVDNVHLHFFLLIYIAWQS